MSGRTTVVGRITSKVTTDQVIASGTGRLALLRVAAVAAIFGVLGLLLYNATSLITQVVNTLVPALLMILGPFLIIWVLLAGFRSPGRRRGGGGGRLLAASAGGVTRLIGGLFRALAGALGAGSGVPYAISTEVRRFRVTESSGSIVDCEMAGELQGAQLHLGDVVEVHGRITRHGTLAAREVVLVASGTVARGRPNLGYRTAQVFNAVALVVGAVLLAGVLAFVLAQR